MTSTLPIGRGCAPHLTDHAVLRFLERAYGLGELIAGARQEMINGTEPAIDFQAPVAIVHNTRLVIRDGVVVTATPTGKRRRRG